MDPDSDDSWSDTSSEEEDHYNDILPLHSRAYQVEMFEHSMQGNIIAVMGTGSGKTQIAKLRIEAELLRSIGKRVWFVAPKVVLAYQQYAFLSRQLPAFQLRLITGMDGAEYWTTREIWDKVLFNIDIVISTPRILLDALTYSFVSLRKGDLSLLVIDEAHHCVGLSDMKQLMQTHYHAYNTPELTHKLPHILGLSACPITKKSTAEINELEINLNAKCKTPLEQVEEYAGFVYMPQSVTVTYGANLQPCSKILTDLTRIISSLQVEDDPWTHRMRAQNSLQTREKLTRHLKKNATPAMVELHSFLRSSLAIHEGLGSWASDAYTTACLQRIQAAACDDRMTNHASGNGPNEKVQFFQAVLQSLMASTNLVYPSTPTDDSLSSKVDKLFDFLVREYRSTLRGLIFVQERHMAWALSELINAHPSMQSYRAFSFVGVSNPAHEGLFRFADLRVQNENLEKFRRGELNLCIATSVLEEGIDVPAMNLVICFDERPNMRSFVQSRGRARQQHSKFVLLRAADEPNAKIQKWKALEEEMKLECENTFRALEERKTLEVQDVFGGEIFRVKSTGATLTFDNARQLLQRFCAKLPCRGGIGVADLTFCIDGEIGLNVSAHVYLPTSLPPNLQYFRSKSTWRTEKMAKRDAAFQAYLSLYEAGLVTENLLPPEFLGDDKKPNRPEDIGVEEGPGFSAVGHQYDPWPGIMDEWAKSQRLFAHKLQFRDDKGIYASIFVLLPLTLPRLAFPLYTASSKCLQVSLGVGEAVHGFPLDLAREVSFHLLMTILGRRLQGVQKGQLPFLLVPEIEPKSLEAWYAKASASKPLVDLLQNGALLHQDYLLRNHGEPVPYLYSGQSHPFGTSDKNTYDVGSMQIPATALLRKLEYLTPTKDATSTGSHRHELLLASDCTVLGLPVEYGPLMLLIPSVTHMLEIGLRSAEACKVALSSLSFKNIDLVSEALTLPSVGTRNYQRLEFLGDDLLKYYASLQVFVDRPDHPENQLTLYRERIVSNARLQRTTLSLDLDQFITRYKFSGGEWRAGVEPKTDSVERSRKKILPSKTLADVVEALIGAASLDGEDCNSTDSEARTIGALRLFLDEVPWRSVAENISKLHVLDDSALKGLELFAPVESLVGYSFQNRSLLAEALTHSCLRTGVSSYDRLEFLGDAILDHIVKRALFASPLLLDPEQMTLRRHALVSHVILAFFALELSHTCDIFEIKTDFHYKRATHKQSARTVYLPDYIKRIGSPQDSMSRELTLAAYGEVRSSIRRCFEHGLKFPWTELSHLRAPKSYSDVVESVLGAVFVDSRGDLEACTRVLDKMGLMKLVHRFSTERELDLVHPEAVLAKVSPGCVLVAQERRTGWRCKVLREGERVAHAKRASCKDEARCRAAERAVEGFSQEGVMSDD